MSKRRNDNDSVQSSKRSSFNIWKKEDTIPNETETPLESPSSSNNKYNFNIWNKTSEESNTKTIQIKDLKVGTCMHRPLIFRTSFKSFKRESKGGDMFIFHAMDDDKEIQVTVFAQQTKKFYDVIQFNRTYELVNFNVKMASEDFPLFIGECLYISLLTDSKIKEVNDDSVSSLRFNFQNIGEILALEVNSKCDFIAVIAKNWGVETVAHNKSKRELTLTDKSKECMALTLWGNAYDEFNNSGTCVLIHNGIVKEFNGIKTISCAPNTLFWQDPDIDMARELQSWFDHEIYKPKE